MHVPWDAAGIHRLTPVAPTFPSKPFICSANGSLDQPHTFCCHRRVGLAVEFNLGTNCNQLAEAHPVEWKSNGALVDDACDPAPCPDPSLAYTHFEPGTPIDPFHDYGRAIHDRLENAHTLSVGEPAASAHLGHGDYLGPCH